MADKSFFIDTTSKTQQISPSVPLSWYDSGRLNPGGRSSGTFSRTSAGTVSSPRVKTPRRVLLTGPSFRMSPRVPSFIRAKLGC
jgi:hypothetical protein